MGFFGVKLFCIKTKTQDFGLNEYPKIRKKKVQDRADLVQFWTTTVMVELQLVGFGTEELVIADSLGAHDCLSNHKGGFAFAIYCVLPKRQWELILLLYRNGMGRRVIPTLAQI